MLAVFGRRPKNLTEKVDERNHLFWGLRDLSFDIHEGETVALIGHNGAGKSLLLRILSRITRPTSGEARLYGRVRVLDELGRLLACAVVVQRLIKRVERGGQV